MILPRPTEQQLPPGESALMVPVRNLQALNFSMVISLKMPNFAH
jgi:hypothetical protein